MGFPYEQVARSWGHWSRLLWRNGLQIPGEFFWAIRGGENGRVGGFNRYWLVVDPYMVSVWLVYG